MTKQYGKNSKETILSILQKSEGHCWYCGRSLSFDSRYLEVDSRTYVIDHFIPLALGGKDDFHNLVPSCFGCNSAKRNYSIEEFRLSRSIKLSGIPRFDENQIAYLNLHGIQLPKIEKIVFYFEREGLKS